MDEDAKDDIEVGENTEDVASFEDEETSDRCEEKLLKVKAELKKCLAEKDEYLNGWQRARADFVNAKKSHDKEVSDLGKIALESFVVKILPVVDSFEVAFANKERWEKVDSEWRVGVEGIYSKLMDTLRRSGLEEIGALGERFDINVHQPVSTVPVTDEDKDDVVTEIVQKGYRLGNRVVRPCKVIVGQLAEEPQNNN
ncbi:MAG: nucleotide exchange factor GrpE [Candidatus Vogelbacteria bacterium]|nr:nucleotide exchange factor GrpE [Candidatus Vogelbacteria bacterium]